MLENKFQKMVIDEIKQRLPGAIVFKNDAGYIQGFPDLTVLYGENWALLECKREKNAAHQPNQDYYVEKLGEMSFSSFIYPENKEDVLNAMEQSLKRRTRGRSRVPKSI